MADIACPRPRPASARVSPLLRWGPISSPRAQGGGPAARSAFPASAPVDAGRRPVRDVVPWRRSERGSLARIAAPAPPCAGMIHLFTHVSTRHTVRVKAIAAYWHRLDGVEKVFLAFLLFTQVYYSYRYAFQIQSNLAPPGYESTPEAYQYPKYAIAAAVLGLLAI